MGDQATYTEPAGQAPEAASYNVLTLVGQNLIPGDVRNFIKSKWIRSQRYENDFYKLVDPDSYWRAYDRHIEKILNNPATRVNVAVLSDDPDVLLGFAVYRGSVLDYVYVHKHQRMLGIGKALMPKGIDTISGITNAGLKIWAQKYSNLKFNPFD